MLLTHELVLWPRALDAFNGRTCTNALSSYTKFAFLRIDTHVNYPRTTSKLHVLALNAFNVLTCTTASNSFLTNLLFLILDTHVNHVRTTSKLRALNAFNVRTLYYGLQFF